jgi:hypothetical protein
MVLVVRKNSLAVLFESVPRVGIFVPQGSEWFPRGNAAHLCVQQVGGISRVSRKVYLPDSKQRPVADFEANGDLGILRYGALELNDCFRVAQFVQDRLNRESDSLECRRVCRFTEAGR